MVALQTLRNFADVLIDLLPHFALPGVEVISHELMEVPGLCCVTE